MAISLFNSLYLISIEIYKVPSHAPANQCNMAIASPSHAFKLTHPNDAFPAGKPNSDKLFYPRKPPS